MEELKNVAISGEEIGPITSGKKELNEAIQLGMKPHLHNFTGVLPLRDWQKKINQL